MAELADILRLPVLVLGGVGVVVMSVVVWRSVGRLQRRIDEFTEEEANRTGPAPDPWAAFAALWAEEQTRAATRKANSRNTDPPKQ